MDDTSKREVRALLLDKEVEIGKSFNVHLSQEHASGGNCAKCDHYQGRLNMLTELLAEQALVLEARSGRAA